MSTNLSDLPNSVHKRDILFGVKKVNDKELTEMGHKFLNAGWFSDAIDFFIQAKNLSELKNLQKIFVEQGDVFLLQKTLKLLPEDSEYLAALKDCSEKAASLGKTRYAIKGFEKLGDTARVATLTETISQDPDMLSEAQPHVFIPLSEEELNQEYETK